MLSLLAKAGMQRLGLPALIGFLVIGMTLRGIDDAFAIMPRDAERVFDFLAKLGVIALLFTVGLKSQLQHLVGQLRRASAIWVCDVLASGGLGFLAAWWLGLGWTPALIIGAAMTATSVGVSSSVWESADALDSDQGQLFVDVAELDDISGVIILAVLFAILPELREAVGDGGNGGVSEPDGQLGVTILNEGGLVLLKLLAFGGGCYIFARLAEKPFVRFLERQESGVDAVVSATSAGIILAGLAGLLGFSVAIGAFFAGLAFSRTRDSIMSQTPYLALRDLFVPFFFVGIGLSVSPSAIAGAGPLAAVFVVAAVLGKLLGVGISSLAVAGPATAVTLGAAMAPRAEIAMIIMASGQRLGDWAVTPEQFSAMVVVVLATCLLAPPVLRLLIRRYVNTEASP